MQGIEISETWSPDARGFVFKTLSESFRRYAWIHDNGAFGDIVLRPFEKALDLGVLGLRLMRLTATPDDYIGWSACAGDALIYVYVKQAYRGRGFGTQLVSRDCQRVVYQTPAGAALQRGMFGQPLLRAPYLLLAAR